MLMLKQLRPHQWTKNLLIFAAVLFSIQKVDVHMLVKTIIAFFLFCFVSGCVYILNDFIDREADRQHPEKKHRPMASGKLNPYFAITFGAVLLIASVGVGFYFNILFGVVLLAYFSLNVAYSIKLKHVVIIDVMIIAAGFVFRAIAGGLVNDLPLSPWFLICTMLLSLFLGISKRGHELFLLQQNKGSHRKVLEHYTPELINQMTSIVTTSTIISYSLFTFSPGHSIYLMWTIPLVLYGIFRYLYLIHVLEQGGKPDKILFQDKHILGTVILYAISVVLLLTLFEG
jgi:4-hydroxybenzoate polyprenyltransferase